MLEATYIYLAMYLTQWIRHFRSFCFSSLTRHIYHGLPVYPEFICNLKSRRHQIEGLPPFDFATQFTQHRLGFHIRLSLG